MRNKMSIVLFWVLFSLISAEPGRTAIFNVTNYTEFWNAIESAAENGEDDEINLAAGTYNITSPLIYFAATTENARLTISGAGAGATILDGGSNHAILRITTNFNGLAVDDNSHVVIRNLTFANANLNYSVDNDLKGGALAVYAEYADITLESCTFSSNHAEEDGGAVYLATSYGGISVSNCIFGGNSAIQKGGGAYLSTDYGTIDAANNTFTGNSVVNPNGVGGGGLSAYGKTIHLTSSSFQGNDGGYYGYGGGAFLWAPNVESSVISVNNNSFTNNFSGGQGSGYGGGLYIYNEGIETTLENNTFSGNALPDGPGGGLYLNAYENCSLLLSGNKFLGNSASLGGGAWIAGGEYSTLTAANNVFKSNSVIYYGGGASIQLPWQNDLFLVNNTIVDNQAINGYQEPTQGGGIYLQMGSGTANIYNNILWGNTASEGMDLYTEDWGSTTINIFSCDLSSFYSYCQHNACGDYPAINTGNNINSDPLLTADFHLNQGSPCLNVGDNNAPNLPATDFDGNARILGGTVDIGADEYSPVNNFDFNGDGNPDLVWRNTDTGRTTIWFMTGAAWNGGFADIEPTLNDPSWSLVGIADFNGDGSPDLLWRNSQTGRTTIWYMDGPTWNGGYADVEPTVAGSNWSIVGIADFNGDNNPDLLWRDSGTGRTTIWYMTGPTWNGGYADVEPTLNDPNWSIVGIADFNGDSNPDLLWRNSADGTTMIWYMTGPTWNGGYAQVLPTLNDPNWAIVALRDFNNDGSPDLLWRNTSSTPGDPNAYRTTVWYMDGPVWNGNWGDLLPVVPSSNWIIVGR